MNPVNLAEDPEFVDFIQLSYIYLINFKSYKQQCVTFRFTGVKNIKYVFIIQYHTYC